jgi:2-keto-3-deoxy-L-rhamnonate aldolase RhmA
MTARSIRDMLATKDVKVGHFVTEFVTPGIGHILKAAGCDLVGLDMEHSGLGFDAMRMALRYLEAADLPAVVRPVSKQYSDISRLLDIGATAVMAQSVESAEEVLEIVSFMKYRPKGKRGVTIEYFHDRFAEGPLAAKLADANRETALFVLIETGVGVENADAIAAVDGVDCLYIGHYDLGVDIGTGEQFDHPRMVQALDRVVAAAREHGKAVAWSVESVGSLEGMRRSGADFFFYGSDTSVLRAAVGSAVADIRRRCSKVDGPGSGG